MFRAQIAIERSARVGAVLQEMAGFVRSSGSQVDAQHRLCAGRPAPFDKLVGTESIGFRAQPRQIQTGRPLCYRTDTVFPVVTGEEIAAGVTNDGGA